MAQSPFLKSVEDFMRVRRYSRRTIDSYLYWVKYSIVFDHKQHSARMNDEHIVGLRLAMESAAGLLRRHHFDESTLNKLIWQAARMAGITKGEKGNNRAWSGAGGRR